MTDYHPFHERGFEMSRMTEEKLLSIKEAAQRMRVSDRTIRNWIDSGRLEAITLGGCTIRTSVEAIERMAQPYQTKAASPVTAALAEHNRDLVRMQEEHGLTF
jgi:excisionase family DNA binding protein